MCVSKTEKVVVIGAGIGGLATAIRLSIKGYSVDVFESNPYVGGKLSQINSNGFRFDAGPSLFTMPELVDELYRLADKNPRDFFNYQRLDESCRYFYPDGTFLRGFSDINKFAEESAKQTGVRSEDVKNHLKKSAYIYDATAFIFLERSLHKLKSYCSFKVLKSFLKLPFLGLFSSMHSANFKALKNEKMTQLFDRYATYNGSNPYVAPSILNIIPHLEFNKGAYFPKNGMYSIANSLFELAQSLGVRFHLSTKVTKILVKDKKTIGVEINGEKVMSDYVVSNLDVHFVYDTLLKEYKKPMKILKQERSTSALIFYWGMNKSFENLDLHNLFFSDDYKAEFNALQDGKDIYYDPTVYVNITSKKNKSDAPEGCENWFVMINVPANKGQDWDSLIAKARINILQKLSKELQTNIESLILTEEILEPRTIESKTASYQGSLYGTASNNKMAAFFRHSNFSNDIKGLYFCGGSVHPGGGIPLALSSAKIIDGFFESLN
jgi:phytoene desaturase